MEKRLISNLTNEEKVILDQVLVRCAIRITSFLENNSNLKKYGEFLGNKINKEKNFLGIKLFSRLLDMNKDKLYTRTDLKNLIEDGNFKQVVRKVISLEHISESTFSKIYSDFEDRELLFNITTKNKLKDIRTKEFLETGHKNNYKTSGRISFYRKNLVVEKVIDIISRPEVYDYITYILNKFDNMLNKFLKFLFKSFIYLLPIHSNVLEIYIRNF
ncbi:MAG: hypothetical protein ACRD6U_06690 [Nitrososphaeraceae archaeon]